MEFTLYPGQFWSINFSTELPTSRQLYQSPPRRGDQLRQYKTPLRCGVRVPNMNTWMLLVLPQQVQGRELKRGSKSNLGKYLGRHFECETHLESDQIQIQYCFYTVSVLGRLLLVHVDEHKAHKDPSYPLYLYHRVINAFKYRPILCSNCLLCQTRTSSFHNFSEPFTTAHQLPVFCCISLPPLTIC